MNSLKLDPPGSFLNCFFFGLKRESVSLERSLTPLNDFLLSFFVYFFVEPAV